MAAEINLTGAERVGEFRFVRALHAGPTSLVSEVIQDSTNKRFALKMLKESRAGEASERRLFEFEAKIGMQMQHRNLVPVYEYFRQANPPYFVMEFFNGQHLKLPIARPSLYPLPTSQHHKIIEQIAKGLAYMHAKGWVHRDVKPENVLVNKSGEVKVIDYGFALRPFSGLAKFFKKKAPVQGTTSYMAPEQIRGESPEFAADIYSFGITCYELTCGRPPFRGNSQSELLNKHLKERPAPLTMHNKDVTNEFNDLILKAIQKKPADRFESFDEFLSAFARVRVHKTDPLLEPSRTSMGI